MTNSKKTSDRLVDLLKLFQDKKAMLIVLQDNPDPDAMGAAWALRKLANQFSGINCSLACGGGVGRAENRAMARYLGVNLRKLGELDTEHFDLIAMVDTQPRQGNNSLPGDIQPDIVIDHHPRRPASRGIGYTDIRSRYGSTCTILMEYLNEAKITPDPPLATALLYGIRSDTQDLGRESTKADMLAYEQLYPLANKRMLGAIQRGQVPTEYFRVLSDALVRACRCGPSIVCDLGTVNNPDMVSEIADLLLRHEKASWSLCWAVHEGRMLLSIRNSVPEPHANAVMRKVVAHKGTGGGHRSMAGGQIPLEEQTHQSLSRLGRLVQRRFLRAIGQSPDSCTKLLS